MPVLLGVSIPACVRQWLVNGLRSRLVSLQAHWFILSSHRSPRMTKPLHIQSNGGGIQSTAMYYMSSMGILPRFDYSVFVDLGAEKRGTLQAIEDMKLFARDHGGVPIVHITSKDLASDTIEALSDPSLRFVSVPFFVDSSSRNGGMLRRQCTSEYKIRQVNAFVKSAYGLSGNQRYPETYIYLGISIDEMSRMAIPEPIKFTNVYPFCGFQTGFKSGRISFSFPDPTRSTMSRSQLIDWLVSSGYQVPPKSSCFFCPYTSDADWLDMKANDPGLWRQAVAFDASLRLGVRSDVTHMMYLHRSRVPLDQVIFKPHDQGTLFDCSGSCHS